MTNDKKISCNYVSKVYGEHSEKALKYLDSGISQEEFQKNTGHVLAVKDISFDVSKGETFVVMGLSGSGKSTLVRCISRLVEPTRGMVLVDGENILEMSDKDLIEMRRHKMSMVFQHFGLFPHRRVIHNVSYGLEIRGVQKSARLEKAREVLELVGLGGWEEYFPEELSGGMQQRVGLARALAVDPEILLFDEPFSALDPLIRREMQDELLRIQELVQKTIIFITHDFLEALKMGDRIAIMKGGEFIQIGKPDDLVLRPADDYVRKFTEDVPRAKVLTAKTIMKPCELIVNETDQYPGIESKLLEKNCGFVFVLDRTGAFLGIISRQHLHESRDSNLELSNFVLNRSNVASSTSTIDDLVERAAATDEPIAIVDDSKKLVGYVDRACLLSALVH